MNERVLFTLSVTVLDPALLEKSAREICAPDTLEDLYGPHPTKQDMLYELFLCSLDKPFDEYGFQV